VGFEPTKAYARLGLGFNDHSSTGKALGFSTIKPEAHETIPKNSRSFD